MRQAHAWLSEIARRLERPAVAEGEPPVTGANVRQQVEACLDDLAAAVAAGSIAAWLHPAVEHLSTVLRRLGDGLYHCYDVTDLPRTNNDLEQFYRHVKTNQRRITGHKRSDSFVVRVGGFAVYAVAACSDSEAAVLRQVASVPAEAWQHERAALRTIHQRQTTMRRFRLHRDAFLADLEARWMDLALPP